jgi:hypothetical protein
MTQGSAFRKTCASMTDRSRPASPSQTRWTTQGLSAQQQALVNLMRAHQFGRIENMQIHDGQPVLDDRVRVVRAVRLGGENGGTKVPSAEAFELKQSVQDLLDELARIRNGTLVRLEFRHGLPFLLETAMPTTLGEQPSP